MALPLYWLDLALGVSFSAGFAGKVEFQKNWPEKPVRAPELPSCAGFGYNQKFRPTPVGA